MSTIRIDSLPQDIDESDLEGLFIQAGNVESARILQDFGLVEFSDEKSVQNAIDQFDNQDFHGRKIRVRAWQE